MTVGLTQTSTVWFCLKRDSSNPNPRDIKFTPVWVNDDVPSFPNLGLLLLLNSLSWWLFWSEYNDLAILLSLTTSESKVLLNSLLLRVSKSSAKWGTVGTWLFPGKVSLETPISYYMWVSFYTLHRNSCRQTLQLAFELLLQYAWVFQIPEQLDSQDILSSELSAEPQGPSDGPIRAHLGQGGVDLFILYQDVVVIQGS